jgi:hypothetical protein
MDTGLAPAISGITGRQASGIGGSGLDMSESRRPGGSGIMGFE